jgi:hypothetical protein
LRGALGDSFWDNPLFHQHDGERVVYRYPLVQYRWDEGGPLIVGLGAAARCLAETEWPGMRLRLGGQVLTVSDAVCAFHRHEVHPTPVLRRYRLRTPWLPFSQENYRRYQSLRAEEQAAERDRLAVAGLLMALRGVGVDFPTRLYAAFELEETQPCCYKGVNLLGFQGRLLANVELPDDLAIGRATSHGYGWLHREGFALAQGSESHDVPSAGPVVDG